MPLPPGRPPEQSTSSVTVVVVRVMLVIVVLVTVLQVGIEPVKTSSSPQFKVLGSPTRPALHTASQVSPTALPRQSDTSTDPGAAGRRQKPGRNVNVVEVVTVVVAVDVAVVVIVVVVNNVGSYKVYMTFGVSMHRPLSKSGRHVQLAAAEQFTSSRSKEHDEMLPANSMYSVSVYTEHSRKSTGCGDARLPHFRTPTWLLSLGT
mmetsp:Transcript_7526/g.17303  ORF Transcript_7526/g.17303 Transcript_7526/m.17303 type:complete len:205 (-) Transcript_7526:199-813(-)